MALQVMFIFICAGLTGIQSISTVGHVAVEAGGTVHIPCQYEDKYTGKVKYLCRGSIWDFCSYEIKTNQGNSSKYSIKDDKTRRIVTFTIKNLQFGDSGFYWCGVEITGTDDGKQFRLSVTKKGESKLRVDSQWITGYFGGQVTVYFTYVGSGPKRWCRLGGRCVSTSGQIDGANVTANTSVPGLFAVTATGLGAQNIGWYWCSFGDLQMPVFLQLTEKPITTTNEPTSAPPTSETGTNSVPIYIIGAVCALCSLAFVVAVTVVVWCRLKRNTKETEGRQIQKNEELLYSEILHCQQSSNTKKDKEPEVSVIYSTVVKSDVSEQMPRPEKESVVYSSVSK